MPAVGRYSSPELRTVAPLPPGADPWQAIDAETRDSIVNWDAHTPVDPATTEKSFGDRVVGGLIGAGIGALVGFLLLAVFGVGVGSLSYALAIAVRKQEWMFWAVQQTVIFPLMILSGMLLPLETGPGWMQVASKFNPLTYLVDAERALFAGDVGSSAAGWGWVAALATVAVGLTVGIRSMRRSAG
jgi:hypothetical protein